MGKEGVSDYMFAPLANKETSMKYGRIIVSGF